MKKILSTTLLVLFCTFLFAQKTIENPDYSLSTIPGSITKIEILDSTTVLHFQVKGMAGTQIFIPKKSYIQDLSGEEKLFVTKVTGGKIGKNVYPESGVLTYQLHFLKLSTDVKSIDFGEANDGGNWFVYDIVINETEGHSMLPKALRGNWLLTDGSNRWDYGFNTKKAIVDRAIWNYKSVENKGKKYKITIEKPGTVKTIYAKLNNNGTVDFGLTPKALQTYSLERTDQPDFKLEYDKLYEASNLFKIDSTTYSGVIKGYTERLKQKTGMVYVNNVFTGNQDSYLVKISDDGSFSIKLPINYPQSILVRVFGANEFVFVEPGKETFHLINGEKSLFMGDCAQVNSDLLAMKDINYFDFLVIMNKIGITSPEAYKKICFEVRDKELEAVKTLAKKQFISNKALQIKNIDITYSAFEKISGYEMYRGSLERRNKSAKTDKQKKPFKTFKVNKSFYDFVSQDVINNKLAVLSSNYNYFINRFMYADIFRNKKSNSTTTAYIANMLQKEGKEISVDELAMAEMSKIIETPEMQLKRDEFRKNHGKTEQAFYGKYAKEYAEFLKQNKIKPKHTHFILNVVDYLTDKGETLNEDEVKLVEAIRNMKTEEEKQKEREFNATYGEVKKQFYNKYKNEIQELNKNKHYKDIDDNIIAFLGSSNSFMYDVISFQKAAKRLEDYQVYTDLELLALQQKLNDPFASNYLAVLNENTKEKIELNKSKGGYTVNTVEKSEGDELFDAMIKKFKGKVVHVDFWATWCGPCKSGISRIKPLKEDMKNDNVVFLYITNQTSPEGTWKNAIPDIKGEHYRVSQDEWNYLANKFKISGIPHYTLVNKEGNVVKPKMGHLGNDRLKQILREEIEKGI